MFGMAVFVVLLATLPLSSDSQASDPGPLSSIRGTVVESNMKNRVPFAVVFVVGERKGAMTDESGDFVIPNLSPGEHRIRARSLGFEDKDTTVFVVPNKDVLVVLRLNEKAGTVIVDDFGIVPDFTSAILPARSTPLHVGDQPSFQVEIRNRSSDAVWLVRSRNGLAHNDGYPEISITIDGPAGGYEPVSSQPSVRPIALDDFAEVPAHKSFSPFSGAVTLAGTFRKPGHYVATFSYSVNRPDARQTRGWPADVVKRIQEVPWLDLQSTTSFEVLP